MTAHAPIPDFSAARAAMVDAQLRPEGVNYPPVLDAMAAVPRERFVAEDARPLAYIDRPVPMGDKRQIPSPVFLGRLLTEMTPLEGESALIVGCGSGYSAAVLQAIGLTVTGLECSSELAAMAKENGVDVVEGPLEAGWKKRAPYHLVLIDGAVDQIPQAIIGQLTPHGRLGTALVENGVSRLAIGRKAGEGFGVQTIADLSTPRLPGFSRPRAFTF